MPNLDLITRRALIQGTAATAAIGLTGGETFGSAPLTNKQPPGYSRFKVGAFEVTVISDGPLSLGPPSGDLFKNVSTEEMTQLLTTNFLPADKVEFDQNAIVVNTGKKLVLFDTGVGKGIRAFGPNAGRMLTNLKAAGINPNNIDVIALTHAHPDHCFGIMSESGRRNFPKAQIYITQADYDFWTDEGKGASDMFKMMTTGARKNLVPNRGRIVFVKDGQEIAPGIQAMATAGHTVGHTSYMITSQNQSLCNLGDVAHHHLLSVERPQIEFAFDTDGKQAVETRKRVFDMLATTRIPMIAYHFPWPGVGYLSGQGEGFRYHPAWMRTVL